MKRDTKRVLILSLKIGVGSAIAIILAYFFKLDNPTSAGTIALLSLLTTKWGTVKLVLRRISTFFVTILFCFIFFELISSHWIAFGLVLSFAIRCIENEILMHFRSRKKSRGDVSIFEPIGTDKEGNQIHLVDVIENGQSDVVSDIEASESLKILRKNMRSVLSDREYYIITKRFGLDGKKELTQRQIAKNLGISRSYVSRIEKAGLKKLRKLLE